MSILESYFKYCANATSCAREKTLDDYIDNKLWSLPKLTYRLSHDIRPTDRMNRRRKPAYYN